MTQIEKEQYFNQMLDNVYLNLEEKIIKATSKMTIPVPVIEMSTTNTYWKNIKKILQTINRPGEHFITYLQKELKTGDWLSNSKSDGIVLLGKFKIAQLTILLQGYIKTYVVCNICNSTNTNLDRNKDVRSYMICCNKCNSKYTVS